MNKFKKMFFYLATFGIGYLIAKSIAKKNSKKVNACLKYSNKIPFEISSLIDAIGGKKNYLNSHSTINSLIIEVTEISLVSVEKIKSLGPKGTLVNNNKITCLFGDYSKLLKEKIEEFISKI